MKGLSGLAVALAVLAAAAAAFAQVDIKWTFDHQRVVLFGPMDAHLKIANFTGTDLRLGPGGNAALSFFVDDTNGGAVASNGRPMVRYPVSIPDSATAEVTVDLSDAYPIVRAQSYMVSPVLEVAGERFGGSRQALEVQPGLEVARLETGLERLGNDREATLRMIHRDREDIVFFRLDAPSAGQCLGVYELGTIIRFFKPRVELDVAGNFHVLHQSAPDRFVHSVFGGRGAPVSKELYTARTGAIRLVRDDAGVVEVQGGTRFELDPELPGKVTAPALPPSVPYKTLDSADEMLPKKR
jgi:hypothetical protein